MTASTSDVAAADLRDRLAELGARVEEETGPAAPADFGDPAAEHAAARATVGIAPRPRAFTLVEGPDAVRFLQSMVTQDVAAIAPGSARYALLLTPKARIVADLRLLRQADDAFLLDSDPPAAEGLRRVLTRYRLAAKARIAPADDAYAALVVAGPATAALVGDALGTTPLVEAEEGRGTPIPFEGETIHALVSVLTGGPAVELVVPRACLGVVWDALAAALPRHGGRPIGARALERLRIEAGVPRFGAELDEQVMPAEAGVVDRAVSFTKGCYPGQEPVARLHYRGHANRGLRTLRVDGPAPAPGTPIEVDGRELGRVTSAVAPAEGGPSLALALLRREVEDGRRVRVGSDEAEVVETPLRGSRSG